MYQNVRQEATPHATRSVCDDREIIATKLPQTGGCLCGKIRYEITEAPQLVYTCHCVHCQRLTSSAFSMAIVVTDGAFRIAGIEPRAIQRTADSGAVVTRWVCPECGSWVCGVVRRVRMMACVACGQARWTIHPGCARQRISGPAASSPGLRCQRRSDFRDAACHIIRADETAFSRPILALEERDGELC